MNCRGVDGNCREIDLIRGSQPLQRNKEIQREREREREKERCTNALRNWFILQLISNIELIVKCLANQKSGRKVKGDDRNGELG